MKFRFLAMALLISASIQAQSFYDQGTIQRIDITFSQSNWDALLDAERAGADGYLMAQSVAINGTVFDSVGVKYKGNSTYNSNYAKNPWHIELDTYKSQDYQGYKDIKLSNVAKDPSFLREVLSYEIARKYMVAPLSNYANVYVNGTLIGLYSNSEAISKTFVDSHLYSKNGAFVKCNPPAGAGPGTSDYPGLEYLGQDSLDYYDAYELKSDAGWQELIDLMDTLENQTGSIEEILDVDAALWMLAYDNALVNLDSYIGGFKQNYYLYRMENGRFVPIVWDMNESFGQFAMSGSGNLTSTTAKSQMSHMLHSTDAAWPLISELLADPMYERMYLAHLKTIVTENFNSGTAMSVAQTLYNTIDTAVSNDPNKLTTYANFQSNITADVSSGGGGGPGGGGTTPGLQALINGRSTYLLSRPDFTATQPTITNVAASNATPSLGNTVYITATVADEDDVYLAVRDSVDGYFEREPMFDDGAHGDGAANDGVYGASITMTSALKHYYIYAENSNIGAFSPARAAHEYHVLAVGIVPGDLVINEFMASNDGTITDASGEYSDWIEIYNASNASIDLGAYTLTDNLSNPNKYEFPTENLAAGDFKLIWASGDTTVGSDHADFKLSAGGEEVGLFKENGSAYDTTDFIIYTAQTTDVSFGRQTDASSTWVFFNTATPDASNGTLSLEEGRPVIEPHLYPNPFSESFTIENPYVSAMKITVYNLQGRLILTEQIEPYQSTTLEDLGAAGLRVLHFEAGGSHGTLRLIKR